MISNLVATRNGIPGFLGSMTQGGIGTSDMIPYYQNDPRILTQQMPLKLNQTKTATSSNQKKSQDFHAMLQQ